METIVQTAPETKVAQGTNPDTASQAFHNICRCVEETDELEDMFFADVKAYFAIAPPVGI